MVNITSNTGTPRRRVLDCFVFAGAGVEEREKRLPLGRYFDPYSMRNLSRAEVVTLPSGGIWPWKSSFAGRNDVDVIFISVKLLSPSLVTTAQSSGLALMMITMLCTSTVVPDAKQRKRWCSRSHSVQLSCLQNRTRMIAHGLVSLCMRSLMALLPAKRRTCQVPSRPG